MTFSWADGRKLANITKGTDSISYTYGADGLRSSKTVNGTTTDYYYLNGTLYGQKTGSEYILFLYDENGTAYGFAIKNETNEETYYYEFNLQGDVIGIIDSTGAKVVEYEYGAWGDILSVTGTLADSIGQKNPLRYRGYYYDAETGFYLTGTRYYDPEIGRFVNADIAIAGVGGDVRGYNMYSYCFNNPTNMSDPTGKWPKWLEKTVKVASIVVAVVAVGVLATQVAAVATGALVGAAAGKAVFSAAVFVGAALSGINGGVANEKKGNSYINGYIGGATGGLIQGVSSKTAKGVVPGGGLGVATGTFVTDTLNNIDPDSANFPISQVMKNSVTSGMKALATSSLTASIGKGVGGINYYTGEIEGAVANGCGGLMPTLTLGFGEGIKAFFGWADDAVIYLWE